MQQCGLCSMLSGLLRRAMCVGSRRGSSESYYRELGDQDTLKIEDRSSDGSEIIVQETPLPAVEASEASDIEAMVKRSLCTGRFLTLHKRRKKRLLTRSLCQEAALLDDLQIGQVKCILEQSVMWKFNAFTLENVSGGRCLPVLCVHLFHTYGLISHFKLDVAKAWKLFSLIEEGYHSTNPYHNSVHAADVTQAMHCFLQQKQIRDYIEPMEIMVSLLAAIAHDMDHPGVNQPFLIATSNHLAALYRNTSVLENHHWRSAISCLIESDLLEAQIRNKVENQISSLILATDITRQQEFLNQFKTYLDTNTLDMRNKDHRHLVLQIALKCADISNPCRPWEISRKWSLKVCEEFFRQGDYERKLNLPVTALCDRHTTSIPKIQTGFFKFVVTPLIKEWHRFLQNDLSAQMLENLLYNQRKWETLVAEEIAEETKTEISDADMVDDDLETCSGTNVSDSSELLLPLRRSSLNPAKPNGLKEQLRRFSVPLNVFQDSRFRSREKSRDSLSIDNRLREQMSPMGSEHSIHSQLSVRGHCEIDAAEKVLSTEKLLPDSSIASITTPVQATRLNTVLKDGGSWKLIRQQTFPPLETTARSHAITCRPLHTSNEEAIYPPRCKTDFALKFDTSILEGKFSSMFKKNDIDKTENDDASENINVDVADCPRNLEKENLDPLFKSGRRESATAGSQLRENLTSIQLGPFVSDSLLLRRRKSMPADVVAYTPKEKKMREVSSAIPQLLKRTLSGKECWSRRRGSAPVNEAPSELRGLAALGSLRHSVNGGRRKPSAIVTCQQWLVKATYGGPDRAHLPRRSSLPVEVMTGISSR